MKTETYQEILEYEWVKTKRFVDGGMAIDTFKELSPADWYEKDTLVFVISENQVYRAKHTKRLKYIGLS